jgi:phosphate/sulfate permease
MPGHGGGNRLSKDLGFIGAMIGLAISVVLFVVLGGLSIWMERSRIGRWWIFSPCLLRLVALMGLTLGMGIGYMVGRSMMGR